MKKLYLVAGRCGAGKDAVVNALCRKLNKGKVVSFTDAPIRSDQTQGVEHFFVTKEQFDEIYDNSTVLAYTKIGENRYCATLESLDVDTLFYIIDPEGIKNLKERFPDKIDSEVIYLYVPEDIRKKRLTNRYHFDVSKRLEAEDAQFSDFEKNQGWDYFIENDGELEDTVRQIASIVRQEEV